MTLTSEQIPEAHLRSDVIQSQRATTGATTHVLTDTQLTALDLYTRGLNVIPLRYGKKKPYILEPFFTARLHHCGPACQHKGQNDIAELFRHTNIGIMTGRTSGNLIAIDCDSQVAFRKIGLELTARNLPFWAVSGHRGGAYLLRVVEGEAGNIPKAKSKFADVEIWGNRHLMVTPPSIHPLGDVYQWVTPEPRFYLPAGTTIPAVRIAQLDFLGVKPQLDARKERNDSELLGLPGWATGLSRQNRQTLTAVLTEGERNNRIFSLACDMQGIGVDYKETEVVIMDIADRAGLPRDQASATLRSAYSKEREPARGSEGGLKEWQRAQILARSYDWYGKFGRKALKRRAVYLACIERARRDGRTHWRATAREVAELANLNKKTAAKSLQDLARALLVKRVNPDKHNDAGIYRFLGLSMIGTVNKTGSYSVPILDAPKTQAEQDVFGKIGLVSWHVWRILLKQPARNATEIAKATGLRRSSVYAALKILRQADIRLVISAEGVYYGEPRTDASLAEMAARLHAGSSPSQNRKEVHKLEREQRVNRLVIGAIWRARS
jgi:predicted transcriptional regulator